MKKLLSLLAIIILSGAVLSGCANNSITALSADSVRYTCVVENCTDSNHAHNRCELQDCDILNEHSHQGMNCTLQNCSAESGHQHGDCGIEGCSSNGSHCHNSCGTYNCRQKERHSHNSCC